MRGYAQRRGKRSLVHPLSFHRGVPPLFASAERRHPIIFPYGWQEHDMVSIDIPDGFVLDNAENPGGINFGAPGSYELKMSVSSGRELICERDLTFGKEGFLAYPPPAPPPLPTPSDTARPPAPAPLSLTQPASAVSH